MKQIHTFTIQSTFVKVKNINTNNFDVKYNYTHTFIK